MIYKSYLIEKNIEKLKENFILFYGQNIGLKNHFKFQIKLMKGSYEILIYDQSEIIKNSNLLLNEIKNISLFGKNKILIIDQGTEKILNLISEIERDIGENRIYIFSDLLDKKSKLRNYFENSENFASVACYEDNEISLKKIILEHLKGFDGLNSQNINLILENCGLDRNKLMNELSKIKLYFQTKKIETSKLGILLDANIIDDFTHLRDSALIGNKLKTNKLLSDTVIDKDKNVYYLNSINQRLFRLKEIKELNNKNLKEAVDFLKPPIFWKDKPKILEQIKKWDNKKINSALSKTYNVEIEIKSNSDIDKSIIMRQLLIDICEIANA